MENDGPSYRQITYYFLPLALQAISQSLTYPLVAMVASRGAGGALNLAGLAQSNIVMFLVGTLGSGLITTGMVYGKSRSGLSLFSRVNTLLMIAVIVLHSLFCLPKISHIIFGVIMGLPPSIEAPAKLTFLAAIPLQFLFFIRNPYQVVLFIAGETGKAFYATMGRILFTLALSPLFCFIGAVGPIWAVACLTIPVILEYFLLRFLALPYLKTFPEIRSHSTAKELLAFTLPFSLGGVFLALSASLIGSFASRASNPEHVLPAYYLALGLASPLGFATTRVQLVVLTFGGNSARNKKIFRFTSGIGILMGLIPLLFLIPPLAKLYYVQLQNLPFEDLPLIRMTAFALILYPLSLSFRAYYEGRAAFLKKPTTVLAGQAVYLGMVGTCCFLTLNLGFAGNLIGPIAILVGNLSAMGAILISLQWEESKEMPIPLTQSSEDLK